MTLLEGAVQLGHGDRKRQRGLELYYRCAVNQYSRFHRQSERRGGQHGALPTRERDNHERDRIPSA